MMKIWDNGKIREMTKEEIKEHNSPPENITETKDKFDEFIEKISKADSIFDIVKIAKELKNS